MLLMFFQDFLNSPPPPLKDSINLIIFSWLFIYENGLKNEELIENSVFLTRIK